MRQICGKCLGQRIEYNELPMKAWLLLMNPDNKTMRLCVPMVAQVQVCIVLVSRPDEAGQQQ